MRRAKHGAFAGSRQAAQPTEQMECAQDPANPRLAGAGPRPGTSGPWHREITVRAGVGGQGHVAKWVRGRQVEQVKDRELEERVR